MRVPARLLASTLLFSSLLGQSAIAAGPYDVRVQAVAESIATCGYFAPLGLWPLEEFWQTGSTLEALADALTRLPADDSLAELLRSVLYQSFGKRYPPGFSCLDDHQW